MSKMKKVLIVGLILSLLVAIGYEVKASDNPIDLDLDFSGLLGNTTNTNTANAEAANAIYANSVYANQVAANSEVANRTSGIIQPVDNENEADTDDEEEETLPQAGSASDITLMFFIVVCAVSAIYAYKKIRDYNM